MAHAAVGDIVAYSFRGQMLGQKMLTTFHFRLDSLAATFPTDVTALTDLDAYLAGAYGLVTNFLSVVPTNYFLDKRWVQRVAPVRQRRLEFGLSTPGTGLGDAESANVSCSIERYTEQSARWAQGRINPPIAPIPTTVLVGGYLSNNQKIRMDNLVPKLYGTVTIPVTAVVWSHVLYHRIPKGGASYHVLTGGVRKETVRVARARNIGVGE